MFGRYLHVLEDVVHHHRDWNSFSGSVLVTQTDFASCADDELETQQHSIRTTNESSSVALYVNYLYTFIEPAVTAVEIDAAAMQQLAANRCSFVVIALGYRLIQTHQKESRFDFTYRALIV